MTRRSWTGFPVTVLAVIFAVFLSSMATAQMAPVIKTIDAIATATDVGGTNTDDPPQQVFGAVVGSHPISASVIAPQQHSSASVSMNLVNSASALSASFQTTMFRDTFSASASASASGQVVFDLLADTSLRGSTPFTSQHFFGSATIKDSGGTTLQSFSMIGTGPPPPPRDFFLPAGRYTFDVSGGTIPVAGTYGNGGSSVSITVIPEPASTCAIVAVTAPALLRRRWRSRE